MKKIGLLLILFMALCPKMMADSGETITIDGNNVDLFAERITFSGNNLTLHYADGTDVTVDMSLVNIHFNYTAELSDAADNDNAATLSLFGDKTVDVKVTRTIKTGQWSPICLPFAMTAEQIANTFGTGTKVAAFQNAADNNLAFESTTAIEAGLPYLVQPTQEVTEFTVEQVLMHNLTTGATASNRDWSFVGTIPETTPTGNVFYFANGNVLRPLSSGNIKALRAYLLSADASANAATFTVDGATTGIMTIDGQVATGDNRIYNIQGQYMGSQLQGLPKGIYIVNGKKVTVK